MIQKYALGCAFTVNDLFYNFPYKKLKFNCQDCFNIIGNNHRDILVKRIFRESVKIIIQDIVERNVTFWLPLNGNKKCNIHMKRVTGKDFQRLRKSGKWSDVDFINSNFSGYEIGFYMLGNRTPRVKTVYVNKQIRETITKYTNLGKQYGDGIIDTTISDYFPQIQQLFPSILKEDIKRILIFAWKSVYLHNSYGGDLLISNNSSWCYIGDLKSNALQHFKYYIKKLIVKIRVNYKRKKIPYNGYCYFALSENQYQQYLQQKNKKGRPKKWFDFGTVLLYEILDECKLNEYYKQYIFKTQYIASAGIKHLVKDFKAQAELIEIRNPLKFKDILVNNNEYNIL